MGKLQKKGERGAAVNYMTRTRAVKKLQISLSDFRRLCILKGIYPREPRNKRKLLKGSSAPKTFYYTKDIQYLAHEPLLERFRAYKAFAKKLARARSHGTAKEVLEHVAKQKPEYTLDHLVKERYPAFIDALRDMDDALCMIFLFAAMPSSAKVDADVVERCQRLALSFQAYIAHTRALRRVFLSIKGIYYQAEVHGELLTWLVPYEFSQQIPADVDFRIMSTFLEFYETLTGFVLYKLYSDEKLVYPPQLRQERDEAAAGLSSLILQGLDGQPIKVMSQRISADLDAFPVAGDDAEDETAKAMREHAHLLDGIRCLFSECHFFFNRETPRRPLEFVTRACGAAQVGWTQEASAQDNDNLIVSDDDSRITHHVIDRPLPASQQKSNRIYVQPQWVFDSINARKLLDPSAYAPGRVLPPHLSPFVEIRPGDYVPEGGEALAYQPQDKVASSVEEAVAASADTSLTAEERQERQTMALAMMSKKDRILYDRIQKSRSKKEEENERLRSRRQ